MPKPTIMTPEEAKIFAKQTIPHDAVDPFWAKFPRQALTAILTAAPLAELPQILEDRDRLGQILAGSPCAEGMEDEIIREGVIATISAALREINPVAAA